MRELSETVEDLKTTRDSIKEVKTHLSDRDFGAAKNAAKGIAERSNCEACEKVELEIVTLVQTLQLAPRKRVEDRVTFVQREVDWILERYNEKISKGEQKLEQLQSEEGEA